jgi:POT family proton-dependent oligopeptide transporter
MAIETVDGKQWLGHPRGLSTLFMTEMWERFSYYGMRALLMLYMVAPLSKGGLGFTDEHGGSVLGTYLSSVYLLSIIGGVVADQWLGLYRSVLVGGILIACGHYCMAYPSLETFYVGLVLIALGTGLLKPNVSSLVGTLYKKDDERRDAGFSIFYMGINVGALIAPLICGWLGQKINWHWGFGAAGVGMTLGLLQYMAGRKYLVAAQALPKNAAESLKQVLPTGPDDAPEVDVWKRISVIAILFFFSVIFWCGFEQASSSLNLFADRMTRLHYFGFDIPSSWFQSVEPVFVVLLATPISLLWVRAGRRNPSSPAKFAYGLLLLGLGFLLIVPAAATAQNEKVAVSALWLVGLYLLHALGELCLSPVGLSTVTKLAPKRVVGMMMGVWFVSLGVGNKVAGYVGGLFSTYKLTAVFGSVAAISIGAALVLMVLTPFIKRLMGDVH